MAVSCRLRCCAVTAAAAEGDLRLPNPRLARRWQDRIKGAIALPWARNEKTPVLCVAKQKRGCFLKSKNRRRRHRPPRNAATSSRHRPPPPPQTAPERARLADWQKRRRRHRPPRNATTSRRATRLPDWQKRRRHRPPRNARATQLLLLATDRPRCHRLPPQTAPAATDRPATRAAC